MSKREMTEEQKERQRKYSREYYRQRVSTPEGRAMHNKYCRIYRKDHHYKRKAYAIICGWSTVKDNELVSVYFLENPLERYQELVRMFSSMDKAQNYIMNMSTSDLENEISNAMLIPKDRVQICEDPFDMFINGFGRTCRARIEVQQTANMSTKDYYTFCFSIKKMEVE